MELKYTYRLAAADDVARIIDFVNTAKHFQPLDDTVGGQWVLAEGTDGAIKAVAWFFYQDQHAYVDYFMGDKVASTLLLLFLYQHFKDNSIKYVRAIIFWSNDSSKRLARGLGMQILDGYCLAAKEL